MPGFERLWSLVFLDVEREGDGVGAKLREMYGRSRRILFGSVLSRRKWMSRLLHWEPIQGVVASAQSVVST